jgi:hypothetical protein
LRRASLNSFAGVQEESYRMTQENATDAGLVPAAGSDTGDEKTQERRRRGEPEAFDRDLEWLLLVGESAMGERGTLGGTIAVLEHGGQFTGVPNTDLYSDQQIGWHRHTLGHVEKHRWLTAAWRLLKPDTQVRLLWCYRAPAAAHRSDEGFGARDKCPRVEDIDNNREIEPQKPNGFHHAARTEAQLGRFAGLAFQLCDDPAALQRACHDPNRGKNGRVIRTALKVAKAAAILDHAEWAGAKAKVNPPRSDFERSRNLGHYDPQAADE